MRLLPVLVVFSAAFIVSSCGNAKPHCTPANCHGCCTDEAECVPGISTQNCGTVGSICMACGAGQACNAGTCEGGSGGAGGASGGTGRAGGAGGGTSGTAGGSSGTAGGTAGAPAGCGAGARAYHLLINEVSVTPTEGEFVEIYNPTSASIDLSQVYLYNATFVSTDGGVSCHYRDIVTGMQCGAAFFDFSLQFPAGASIGPGAVQVIAVDGAPDYCANVRPCDGGVLPTYEIVLTGNTDLGNVANMRGVADVDGGSSTGLLTNGSEELVLFQWDGVSQRVRDVDYVIWGTNLQVRTDKTGIGTYLADTPVANQQPAAGTAALTTSFQRLCTNEGAETRTGGNGLTNHNETSEPLDVTWTLTAKTPGAMTAGEGP